MLKRFVTRINCFTYIFLLQWVPYMIPLTEALSMHLGRLFTIGPPFGILLFLLSLAQPSFAEVKIVRFSVEGLT
jgi:hypothetical protein